MRKELLERLVLSDVAGKAAEEGVPSRGVDADILYRMLTLRLKLNGSLKDKLTRKRNQCCDILESSRRRCDFALTMLLDA
jgi:hypothetical protein